MSDYTRTSRECSLAQLKPELAQPIRAYAAQHSLGDLDAGSRLCAETHSEKKKQGFFASLGGGDPDPYHDSALLLTSAWLIWARSGPKSGSVVSAARLREAEVSAFSSRLTPDSGLEVTTRPSGATEAVTAFIPLAADRVDNVLAFVRAARESAA